MGIHVASTPPFGAGLFDAVCQGAWVRCTLQAVRVAAMRAAARHALISS